MENVFKDMSEKDWRENLTDEQFRSLREKGTERRFTGEYVDKFDDGIYYCAGCHSKLFNSENKFKSGCGWPSFDEPISDDAIIETQDHSFGMLRTEISCANCGGHIGHVFPDGPRDSTGLRYCTNSISLKFDTE
ncbi:MAG: peptide-methionine (R)-S-oxide reductase MsrB [Acidimicrobiia bacterium]|nr:peptide-methionine (R)-S-oxide reductase MsrB [Acidimicrobiia bacterium]